MLNHYTPTILRALEEASAKIMEIYAKDFDVDYKEDKSPVTEADIASNKILTRILSKFNIPIISEEEEKPSFENRKNDSLIWLVDPLDGTREFIKKNDEFCICIALVENGIPILGFIASPTSQTILFGGKSIGAFLVPFGTETSFNEKWKLNEPTPNEPKVIIRSNSNLSIDSKKLISDIEKTVGKTDQITKGSALKFFDLLTGKADIYLRLAPTMEWDIAAGQAIYETIGGEIRNFDTKEELRYNKENLRNPYFLAKLKTQKIDY
jgi:3'(2'), 5'-bisphosphate nucleotidase